MVLRVIFSVIFWLILCRVSVLVMCVCLVLIGLILVEMNCVVGKCLLLSRLWVNVVWFYLVLLRFSCDIGIFIFMVVLC